MLLVWGVSIDEFTDGKVPTLLLQKVTGGNIIRWQTIFEFLFAFLNDLSGSIQVISHFSLEFILLDFKTKKTGCNSVNSFNNTN